MQQLDTDKSSQTTPTTAGKPAAFQANGTKALRKEHFSLCFVALNLDTKFS